jgi:hypothetical protein
MLIVGAMLLIRSVGRLLAVDLGLEPHGVVAIDVAAYGSDLTVEDRWRLYRELAARAEQLPGVSSIGLTSRLPIRDGGNQGTLTVEGNPDLTGPTPPTPSIAPSRRGISRRWASPWSRAAASRPPTAPALHGWAW